MFVLMLSLINRQKQEIKKDMDTTWAIRFNGPSDMVAMADSNMVVKTETRVAMVIRTKTFPSPPWPRVYPVLRITNQPEDG